MKIAIDSIAVKDRKRALDEGNVQELAASMEEVGLLSPVAVSASHDLVAGWHRLEAARRLGWQEIEANVLGLDDLDEEVAEIDENLVRKELSILERGEFLERKREIHEALHPEASRPNGGRPACNSEPISSFNADAAQKLGCTQRSVRHDLQIARGICQEARDALRTSPFADKKSELLALAKMPKDMQVRVADRLASGQAKEAWEAQRQVRVEDAQERCKSLPMKAEAFELFHCGVENMIERVEPESVNLILTDPPYHKDKVHLHDDLARLAAHALTPQGSMLVLAGQMFMLEVAELIGRHLDFRWTICYLKKRGGSPMLTLRTNRVQAFWRPILWFTKSSYGSDGPIHPDVIEAGLPERDLHEWQQDLPGMVKIIERWTLPGDLICDPFLGSGTAGAAAVSVGRRFIGCDTDEKTLSVATDRINEAAREYGEG